MPITRIKGSDKGFVRRDISSISGSIGDVLAFDRSNHVVIKATSSTSMEDVAGVAVENYTTADTTILLQEVVDGDTFIANTTNNSSANHNYQRMVLTDAATVNNTGSDSTNDAAIIMQVGVVGAAGDKKILCRFVTRQDRA